MEISEITADNTSSEGTASAVGINTSLSQNANVLNGMNVNTPEENLSQEQNAQSNTRAFARRLKEKAEEIRAKYDEDMNAYSSVKEMLSEMDIKGESNEELLGAFSSFVENRKAEASKRLAEEQSEKQKAELIHHPLVRSAAEAMREKILSDDLTSLKEAYPNEEFNDLFELGDVFMQLISTGNVDAVSAYAAQKAYEQMNKKSVPASIGSIKAVESAFEKDFYTADEAKRLSSRDFDEDPALFGKVRRSMLKWK